MAVLKDFQEVQFLTPFCKLFQKLIALQVRVRWPVAALQIGV